MMLLDIVILAAGKGTRMKSQLPKVLHTVGGKSLLAHVVDTAKGLNSDNINIIVGHGAEKIESHLQDEPVNYVLQTQQLGTGHAMQQALPRLRKDAVCLILYGDVPLTSAATLIGLLKLVDEQSMALLTVVVDEPSGYGRIIRNAQGNVSAIVEQKDANKDQLAISEINTGIIAARVEHLQQWLPKLSNNNAQKEFYLTDIIAMAAGDFIDINIVQAEDEMEVLGVNNRSQQAELERYFQEQKAVSLMEQGVALADPLRLDIRGELTVDEDVFIDINCIFEGEVELKNNVSIGPNCCIKNSVIGPNTVIKANTLIEDSIVQGDSEIGPFARIRPGTELGLGAKVGNFVETKKAKIGEGSKINHLSYVGDADIGKGVNVGAGVITCNYDGVNKFKTTIEDGAFIGSNSALVAPITIGKDSTVGAGSAVTKNVSDNSLAIARGKQRNLENWQKPTKQK